MDLFSKKGIQELGIKPSKGLGQNFLINKAVLSKIIETADLNKEDIVLEIGPGIGNLTQELVKRAGKVIAVEKDSKMIEILKETLRGYDNLEIINKDILKFEISDIKNYLKIRKLEIKNLKIVANLPYYITSPVIRKLLESELKIDCMVLMVQKEVAQRICSKPPDMSLLSVSVQFYAEPKIISYVKKESFWPKPKVDSAILKITPHNRASGCPTPAQAGFFKVVKAGFSHPRKQLANNLSKELSLDKDKVSQILIENGIKPSQRPETLTVEDWINLSLKIAV